jgi:transcriptional regulator with XRE-family HTH domain
MKKKQDVAFGVRLKELRQAAGLSQRALADKAGLHQFGVAKIEQGLRSPGWETVTALCDALGVSCDEFREGSRTPAERRGPGRPPKATAPKRPRRK